MNDEQYNNDDLGMMKEFLEKERLRLGYDFNEPFEPIEDRSSAGRIALSILVVTLIVVICAVVISVIALQNSGQPLEFSFIN